MDKVLSSEESDVGSIPILGTREESARTFIVLSLMIKINSRNGIDFLFCRKVRRFLK